MTDISDTYQLETVEQMRAIADELRQRIFETLVEQPMTATQIGQRLGVAPAKIHYHVRELERVGLLRLHETREKGGILEKYYTPVARYIAVPRALLQKLSPDEHLAAFSDLFGDVQRAFMRAAAAASEDKDREAIGALTRTHLWLTDEEFVKVASAVEEALEPYSAPRGVEGERERSFVQIMYDTRTASEDSEESAPKGTARLPHVRRTFVLGGQTWSLGQLERAIERGEAFDIAVLGLVHFAEDIPPELVDQVVIRFRHKGVLSASAAVKAVLAKKTGASELRFGVKR
jgi:DNA-binding transcriptional ArsR family regulator